MTDAILTDQLARIENPDRRARFAFVSPALSRMTRCAIGSLPASRTLRTGGTSRG